jgi:MoxR-like ATPase
MSDSSLVKPLTSHFKSQFELIEKLKKHLALSLQGKSDLIEQSIACFMAGGHLLLEGPPGTGKTTLAKTLAASLGGSFNRIQMTSDLLPSDIVGIIKLKSNGHEFEFREGPIFTNFLLADELNRSTPKTQSALLEAMEEGTVTVDGTTYPLPKPFFVIATQNPLEFHGVYPLAESQLDRFMMQIPFSSPEEKDEIHIYKTTKIHEFEFTHLLTLEQSQSLKDCIAQVYVEDTVIEYLTRIVRETRNITDIGHGVSVRGGLQFLQAAKALAIVHQRTFVLPSDIKSLAIPCLSHRLFFSGVQIDRKARNEMIEDIIEKIPAPK